MASIVVNGDTSGAVTLSAPATAGTVTVTLPSANGTMLTTASSTGISGSAISSGTVAEAYGGTGTSTGYYGFKNRIINGAMVLDQRNAGASVVVGSGVFPVDRWFAVEDTDGALTAEQVEDVPAGFVHSLKITTTTADTNLTTTQTAQFMQMIEGFNVSDLGFGSASAKAVTLSYWVKSSLTGLMGGSLRNDSANRSYPFSYTISVANTWEYKTITIEGDTSGTWLTNNGIGFRLVFSLGCGPSRLGTAGAWNANNNTGPTGEVPVIGTLNATWQVTGVQLEKGSTATSFDYRPYGTELALCQRYYYKVVTESAASKQLAPNGFADSTTTAFCWTQFPVEMRISPTALEQTGTAANYQVRYTGGSSANCTSVPTFNSGNTWGARSVFTVASGLTGGQAVALQTSVTAGIYLAWSAEL